MRKSITLTTALAMLLVVGIAAGALASVTVLDPVTQNELDDNWAADRQFPSGVWSR